MKDLKQARLNFLKIMDRSDLKKEQIFEALFDVCGNGDEVNVRHVFFQDVIIKFNAKKARGLIEQGAAIVNESHFVDIALWTYIKLGYPMNGFDKDLQKYKAEYNGYQQLAIPQPPGMFVNA